MRMLSVMVVMIAAPFLSACNTMQGVGKDLKKGGEAVEKAAK